jgi:hypothetical protein
MENIKESSLDIEEKDICEQITEFIETQQKLNNCNIVMGALQYEKLRNIAKEYPGNGTLKVINHLSDLLSGQILDENVHNVIITQEIVDKIERLKDSYLQSDYYVRGNSR